VLVVSSELEEVMGLSDRILVIFRGRIVAEFDPATAEASEIGLAMLGGSR
jgi:simple sugar transport system ATP-binding protein